MRNIFLLLALFATGCTAALDPAESTIKDIGILSRVRENWADDWNTKRIDSIMTLYAPDAVFMRPTAERATGAEAIRALFSKVLATNTPHIVFHGITIEGSGNLAYDSGTYEETVTSGGRTRTAHGDYLLIMKRQNDGHWLIVQQTWTDQGAEVRE